MNITDLQIDRILTLGDRGMNTKLVIEALDITTEQFLDMIMDDYIYEKFLSALEKGVPS